MDTIPIKPKKSDSFLLKFMFYGGVVTSLVLASLTLVLSTKEAFTRKKDTIKVVIALPLSNTISKSIIDGAMLAFAQTPTVGGKKILPSIVDTGDSQGGVVPSKEINAAKDAALDQDVFAYIGPLSSGSADVVLPELNKGYLFSVTPFANAAYLTKSGYRDGYPRLLFPTNFKSLVRVVPTNDVSAQVGITFARESNDEVTVVYDDSLYSTAVLPQMKDSSQKFTFVTAEDFIQKSEATPFDTVYVATPYGSTTDERLFSKLLLLKSMKNSKIVFNETYGDSVEVTEFAKNFTRETYVVSSLVDADMAKQNRTDFYTNFVNAYGYDPDKYSYAGYDSARLVMEVLSKTAIMSRGAYLRTLSSLKSFEGSLGMVYLNEFGDIRNNKIMIYMVEESGKKLVKTYTYEQ